MKYLNKIIEYGLYLLVFILPIQTRLIIKAGELNGGYSEYGTISLYAVDIFLFVLLLLFIVLNFQFSIFNFKTIFNFSIFNYWLFIGLLDLAVFISIFFASDKILAVYRYGVFLLGVGLFWLIVSANYNKTKLYFSLLAGILLQAVLGIWQFITQNGFSINYLGMAVHKAEELGTSVVETIGADGLGERWLRAYGGLPHPNILGGVLSIAILLLIIICINRKLEECDNHSKIFNFKFLIFKQFLIFKFLNIQTRRNVLCVMCYVLFVMALFFTFSRAAWLGLAVGLLVVFIFLILKKDLLGQKKFLQLVLAGGVLVFLLFNIYSNLVNTRIAADSRLEVKSNTERMGSYKEVWEIIKNNWLFGAGMGNYTLAVHDEIVKDKESYYYQPAHNVFLLVWAEIGIFGLLAFLGMLCVMCCVLWKSKNNRETSYLNISILAALIVIMTIDHWLWSLHFGVLFFWLVVGAALREK